LVARHGETQRSRESLEHGLDLVMRRPPIEHSQMYVGSRGLREALKEIFGQLGLEVADALGRNLCVADAIGPSAKIYAAAANVSSMGIRK